MKQRALLLTFGLLAFGALALILVISASSSSSSTSGGGQEVSLGSRSAEAPKEWKREEPKSKFRAGQFRLPKVKGDKKDAELIIYFFGKGSGGSVKDNLERWKGMFRAPKGKKLEDVAKVSEFKVGSVPVTYLDVRGTYLSKFPPFAPNAKTIPLPDHRMIAVVFASDDGPYFLKLVGPEKTVTHHKKSFDEWLKSLK